MIIVKDVTKKFIDSNQEFLVLDKINFEIKENEFVSILGPVGCGKTTLLNIIGGLERPTAGEVFISGEKIEAPRHDIGIIFQGALLFPWKTVRENVKIAVRNNNLSKKEIDKIVEKNLKKVGLLEFADYYPKHLSGGMKQKAVFARILASNYKILLMDEPFSNLDAQTRLLMQEELLKIWKISQLTVLFVTHNIEEAIFLSTKIILLSSIPTRVLRIIDIDLPQPRTHKIWSTSRFNEIKIHIWRIIKKELSIFKNTELDIT